MDFKVRRRIRGPVHVPRVGRLSPTLTPCYRTPDHPMPDACKSGRFRAKLVAQIEGAPYFTAGVDLADLDELTPHGPG